MSREALVACVKSTTHNDSHLDFFEAMITPTEFVLGVASSGPLSDAVRVEMGAARDLLELRRLLNDENVTPAEGVYLDDTA